MLNCLQENISFFGEAILIFHTQTNQGILCGVYGKEKNTFKMTIWAYLSNPSSTICVLYKVWLSDGNLLTQQKHAHVIYLVLHIGCSEYVRFSLPIKLHMDVPIFAYYYTWGIFACISKLFRAPKCQIMLRRIKT